MTYSPIHPVEGKSPSPVAQHTPQGHLNIIRDTLQWAARSAKRQDVPRIQVALESVAALSKAHGPIS
jgi:hypothetical protein